MARNPYVRHNETKIEGKNPIEQMYLDNCGINGDHQVLQIEQVSMNSAFNDWQMLNMKANVRPYKIVETVHEIQHCVPGEKEMTTDTVVRRTRVEMTDEEMAEYYASLNKEHQKKTKAKPKGDKPKAKPKTKK